MSMIDAVNHICMWLRMLKVAFTPQHVDEIEAGHFRVTVLQVLPPPNKQRIFDVAPTGVKYCWQVTELDHE